MENNTTQVEKQEDLKHILSILNKEDADNFMDPSAAKEFGIIDTIIDNRESIHLATK